jgi:hypothetical protein
MATHIRTEKYCLNCGTYVEDRYCPHCGQENVEVKETIGHLISHFFADLTHYDSKFFITVKDLLFRPGFLTREYLAGKRTRYLHPVRMYVFVSFLYFLVSLSFNNVEEREKEEIARIASKNTRKQIVDSLKTMILLNRGNPTKDSILKTVLANIDIDSTPDKDLTIILNINSRDLIVYDSLQNLLPKNERARGLKPWLYSHWLKTYKLYGRRGSVLLVTNRTEHLIPKLMFFLLPIFAWLLYIFYDRKRYFYADHLIFSLHFHTATFLLFLIFAIVSMVLPFFSSFSWVEYILVLLYLGVALKNTYSQSAWITILKVIGLTLLYISLILVCYVLLVTSVLL